MPNDTIQWLALFIHMKLKEHIILSYNGMIVETTLTVRPALMSSRHD